MSLQGICRVSLARVDQAGAQGACRQLAKATPYTNTHTHTHSLQQQPNIQDSIVEQNRQARKAGDDKQLKQAASRRKKLEERWGADKTENGRRFKVCVRVRVCACECAAQSRGLFVQLCGFADSCPARLPMASSQMQHLD